MSNSVLPLALQTELDWALSRFVELGDAQPEGTRRVTARAAVNSPMLYKAFHLFVDNATPSRMEDEEKSRVGYLLLALKAHVDGRPWELWSAERDERESSQNAVLQIRCSTAWKQRLHAYAAQSGRSVSQIIRDAVEEHLSE